jgi:hypothetical protein
MEGCRHGGRPNRLFVKSIHKATNQDFKITFVFKRIGEMAMNYWKKEVKY